MRFLICSRWKRCSLKRNSGPCFVESGSIPVKTGWSFTTLPGERQPKDTTLDSGRNPGFVSNNNFVLANRKFAEANPAAAKFLADVRIPVADLNIEAHKVFEGEKTDQDAKRHAEEWIKAHQDQYNSWLAAARQADK